MICIRYFDSDFFQLSTKVYTNSIYLSGELTSLIFCIVFRFILRTFLFPCAFKNIIASLFFMVSRVFAIDKEELFKDMFLVLFIFNLIAFDYRLFC